MFDLKIKPMHFEIDEKLVYSSIDWLTMNEKLNLTEVRQMKCFQKGLLTRTIDILYNASRGTSALSSDC